MRQGSGLQGPPPQWYPPQGEGSGFLWFSMFSLSFLIVFLWCACWWSLSLAGCIEHVGKPYENIRKPLENHTKPTTHHHRGGGFTCIEHIGKQYENMRTPSENHRKPPTTTGGRFTFTPGGGGWAESGRIYIYIYI